MMKYVLVLSIVSIASCSSDRKTEVDNFYDDLAVPPANKDADRLDRLSPPIDTSLITAINYLKDSLITSRHRFAQIVSRKIDGECHERDTLFFLPHKKHLPILEIDLSGCLNDESRSTSISDSTGLIYFKLERIYDALIYEHSELYFKNNQPVAGVQTNFKWDINSRTLVDSMSTILSYQKLADLAQMTGPGTERLMTLASRLRELTPDTLSDGKLEFTDTIQQAFEESYYLIDSSVYIQLLSTIPLAIDHEF